VGGGPKTGQLQSQVGRPRWQSRLSRLDHFWISSLVENGDDDDSIFTGVIEKRIRKAMQQDSAKGSVDDLKRQWPLLSK